MKKKAKKIKRSAKTKTKSTEMQCGGCCEASFKLKSKSINKSKKK